MARNFRDRKRKPARGKTRDPKPVILLVCEGLKTERQYFEGLVKRFRNPRVRVQVHNERGVPLTLVQMAQDARREAQRRAKAEGDDNLLFDQVWRVFDIDEHPHVPEALDTARQSGIRCAVSNPCFELWLFLHLGDPPGQKSRQALLKALEKLVPGYDKEVDIEVFAKGYQRAVRGAKRLAADAAAIGEPLRNPSTGVHLLAESIRGDAPLPEATSES